MGGWEDFKEGWKEANAPCRECPYARFSAKCIDCPNDVPLTWGGLLLGFAILAIFIVVMAYIFVALGIDPHSDGGSGLPWDPISESHEKGKASDGV